MQYAIHAAIASTRDDGGGKMSAVSKGHPPTQGINGRRRSIPAGKLLLCVYAARVFVHLVIKVNRYCCTFPILGDVGQLRGHKEAETHVDAHKVASAVLRGTRRIRLRHMLTLTK